MKYFICNTENNSALTGISLIAIPSEKIEKIYSTEILPEKLINKHEGEIHISIPLLLDLKNKIPSHALKIKTIKIEEKYIAEKAVLLCPKVDIEIDIPDENIQPLPIALKKLFSFFSGAFFEENKLYLILEPEKIMEHIYD